MPSINRPIMSVHLHFKTIIGKIWGIILSQYSTILYYIIVYNGLAHLVLLDAKAKPDEFAHYYIK